MGGPTLSYLFSVVQALSCLSPHLPLYELLSHERKLQFLAIRRAAQSLPVVPFGSFLTSDMPEYRLHYFDARGRAELIRLIFKYADVPFEDVRFSPEEWPQIKPTLPFGQVPVLEVDGKFLAQSFAIARYLARQYKLVGNDDWEAAVADMFVDTIGDVLNAGSAVHREKDEAKKKELAENLLKEKILPCLSRFESLYKQNGTEYLASPNLTWADLAFFSFSDSMAIRFGEQIWAQTPALKELHSKVASIPTIKNWLETRPQTEN